MNMMLFLELIYFPEIHVITINQFPYLFYDENLNNYLNMFTVTLLWCFPAVINKYTFVLQLADRISTNKEVPCKLHAEFSPGFENRHSHFYSESEGHDL